MITIALDEGGHFENLKSNAKCMYIGGVIFQCKDDDARKKELERLQKFFIEICSNEGCSYPFDLHFNWNNGQIINPKSAEKTKKAVINYLPDFMNGKGKWISERPNGKYFLYALVGDKKGINYFEDKGINKINLKEEISNLIDDNVSSNRYEHMAYRALENILFYNNHLQNDNIVRLNLATRVFTLKNDRTLEQESRRTGHEKSDKYESTFKATTLSSYRAALVSMIQDSRRKDIYFDDISVESIFYGKNQKHNLEQGFLYLSDIVCNVYGTIIEHCNQANTGIEQLWRQCQNYAPNRFFVWTYNDFDQKYHSLYKAFEDEDYYKTLAIMYELSTEKGSEKNYSVYDKLWFDSIKKDILFKSSLASLNTAIENLDLDLTDSQIPVSKAKNIYGFLKPRTEELCSFHQNATVLFHLYKAEFAINNHEGNYQAAFKTFEKCKNFTQYVNIEEYLELRNMYSVSLCDSGNFQKAIEETKLTLSYEELLVDAKKEIFPENATIFVHRGKTQSQLGQCYAFAGDYEKAISSFEDAIKSFGSSRNDILRTFSYLLHTAIEARNIAVYEKYAEKYFGTKNIKEQLIEILSEGTVSNSFALYVYLKAYYCLYAKLADRKKTIDILNALEWCKKFKGINNHPWEMIFKYAAFLSASIGNKEYAAKAEEYISFAKNLNNPEGILRTILEEIDMQYKSVLNGKDAFENSRLTFMYR